MATSRKKPSAAQIAARKLFAQRAKSGEFARKRKKAAPAKKPRRGAARSSAEHKKQLEADLAYGREYAKQLRKNPRSKAQDLAIAMSEQRAGHRRKAKEFFERAARAKNPHRASVTAPSRFEVHRTDARGDSLRHVATFTNKTEAMAYARALANAKGWTVGIKGRR